MDKDKQIIITGAWVKENNRLVGDHNSKIIEHLIANHLIKIAQTSDGWTKLYRDPTNHSYWELTYPEGESHAGGPSRLARVTTEYARDRYQVCEG